MKVNIFWFRRDLRLEDNTGLNASLRSGLPVLPLFIFDTNITDELSADDARIGFIYESLSSINRELRKKGSSLFIIRGDPCAIWKKLLSEFEIGAVFINKDYESYSIERDNEVENLLTSKQIPLYRYKDQVIFEELEICKQDGKPYTVFTPYRNQWLLQFRKTLPDSYAVTNSAGFNFYKTAFPFPLLKEIGFKNNQTKVKPFILSAMHEYDKYRDIPAADKTSYLSPHLRFGTISIRKIILLAFKENITFLNELIWREFFMQILFNFPRVITENFKGSYNDIQWLNNEEEFERWCQGTTGYPMVDAGMRQLNETGYMHNRVRMITAGFLCKHLLIDWRWGEAYFAQKLLDYELSSNNGNWQWAAGTGCDAAPYFRVFNPETQQKKFDPENEYVKQWVKDFGKPGYPLKIVDHDYARKRAIEVYRTGIKTKLF